MLHIQLYYTTMNNSFLPTIAIAIITACYSALMGLFIGLSEPQNYNLDQDIVATIGVIGMFTVVGLWLALYVEHEYSSYKTDQS